MAFEAKILNVLIASPSDTTSARDLVERTVMGWNRDRARSRKVVLLPLRWEFDAVPELGTDAQSVLNRQLVDEADVVIALFHSRIGTSTARGVSGTVEEIENCIARGVPAHVYFSEMPHPNDVDQQQLAGVRKLRNALSERGLIGTYASLEDLASKVRMALERDVDDLVPGVLRASTGEQADAGTAVLRVDYTYDREPDMDSKGRVRMKTRRERLVVSNLGSSPAENVHIGVEPIGDGAAPSMFFNEPIERIPPNASVKIPVAVHMGVAPQWRVVLKWSESGKLHEESQTVTPF